MNLNYPKRIKFHEKRRKLELILKEHTKIWRPSLAVTWIIIKTLKKVVNKNIVRHKNYDLHSNFIRHGFCGDSDHPLTPCKLITLTFLSSLHNRQRANRNHSDDVPWIIHWESTRWIHFMIWLSTIKHIYDFLRASFFSLVLH